MNTPFFNWFLVRWVGGLTAASNENVQKFMAAHTSMGLLPGGRCLVRLCVAVFNGLEMHTLVTMLVFSHGEQKATKLKSITTT